MLAKVSKEAQDLYYKLCVCFGEEDIKRVEYSIQKRPKLINSLLSPKVYNNNFKSLEEMKEYIKDIKEELDINGKEDLRCSNITDIISELKYVDSYIRSVQKDNLEKIISIAPEFENIFINNIPKDANNEDKIIFLSQYIARIVEYSENWFKYCFRPQAGALGSIKLKDGVQIYPTKDETLVIGQGICGDISELAQRLGTKIGLDIGVENVNYKNFGHGLNVVKLSNGKYSNVDITRIIREDKTLSQCILVSNEVLLNQEYDTLRNGNKTNEETETVDREYVETFYKKHKQVIDKMVEDTLELRNRVINDSSFEFPKNNIIVQTEENEKDIEFK